MFGRAGKCLTIAFSLALANFSLFGTSPANASVVKDDQAGLAKHLSIYCWQDANRPTKAVAIAVHGVTMHGGVFDTMARKLASDGIVVYAPDLRGYGRWMNAGADKERVSGSTIDYESSFQDLQSLVRSAKQQHPNVPMFCIGESLGADFALRAAAEMPNAFDGIILSSPAVKIHSFIMSKLELATPVMVNPKKQMDLVKYIKKFASEDPQIVEGALGDPLVRKHLSAVDLYHTANTCKTALDYARKIPQNVSVLVIQGSDDRMVQPKAVIKLISELRSTDQTVRWFRDRGHLLLETEFVRSDTLETVQKWVNDRVQKVELVRAESKPNLETTIDMLKPVITDLFDSATIASQK